MTRSVMTAVLVAVITAAMHSSAPAQPADPAGLAGRWGMNRTLSQFPTEVGFSVDWIAPGVGADAAGRGGGRTPDVLPTGILRPQSEDDAKRVQQLTAEVRTPSTRLWINETPGVVTVTDDQGRMRSFRPDGRDEILQLDGVPVTVNSRREPGRLTVLYKVDTRRELRYVYSRGPTPGQLVVDVQFLEGGQGGIIRRVYEPAAPSDSMLAPRPAPASPPSGEFAAAGGAGLPAATGGAAAPFNQQPDAELKRLTALGVVVEGLTAQAAACGVSQDPITAAVTKRLTDAGFKVVRDSDEDSYVYVQVMTSSISNNFCVSRYDVTIYSHTTATLSYQDRPVLAQVQLLRKGGLTGGAPAVHGAGVVKGVEDYLDQFITRIAAANK